MLIQAPLWSVWLVAALDWTLVMSCDFRCGSSDSSFLFIDLTTVAIGKLKGSFLKFVQFAKEFVFFKVELLELSGKDDIGEMKLTVLLVVILLFLLGFLIVLMGRMFEILLRVNNWYFFVLLLIHEVYVLFFNYRLGIDFVIALEYRFILESDLFY